MEEYDISLLQMRPSLFHVVGYMLLEEFLILSAHLRSHTCHYIRSAIFVHLAPSSLLAADVFGVGELKDDLVSLEDLKEEFSSMAEQDYPGLNSAGQNPQGIETLTALVLVNSFKDSLLSLQ